MGKKMAGLVWEVYFQLVDYSSSTVSSANAQKELRRQLVFLSEASAPVVFFSFSGKYSST